MADGCIYTIALKGGSRPFYVGQTRKKPQQRWREHMKGRTPVGVFLRMCGALGDFEWTVIETIAEELLNEREAFWIAELNTLHPHGLNMVAGGSVARRSATTRARMSEAKRKQWADPEFKTLASESIRLAVTDDRRAAASERTRAQMADPEARRRISEANTGRVRTPAAIERIAEASRKKWERPEYRAAQIKARTGKKASDETRAKMSETRRARGGNSPDSYAKMWATRRANKAGVLA